MRAVAETAILVNSAINYAGVKRSSTLQTSITATKVLAVALIVVVGFVLGSQLPSHYQYSDSGTASFGLSDVPISEFLLAVVAGLFAFGGWHVVTYTAEETVTPERTIPRALGIGIAIVTAAYVALNAVYFYILPVDKVLASTRVAADAAAVVLGNSGAAAISALVMFSVFGAMMGSILAAPRVYFAMARDGLLLSGSITSTRGSGRRTAPLRCKPAGRPCWS
jgi:APA family basic amino acid/polyamine antiporter